MVILNFMTLRSFIQRWGLAFLVLSGLQPYPGNAQVAIGIQREGARINLTAPSSLNVPQQGRVFPEYTVQRSRDLMSWEPVGGKVRGIGGVSGEQLTMSLPADSGPGFYRMIVSTNSATAQQTGAGGAEVFGYGSAFADELAKIGLLSVESFAANWPQPSYLPQITWDPTTAAYWTNFNVDPAVWNATYSTNTQEPRLTDFRLNEAELAIFKTNGFVVSERLGSPSFADSYYRVFMNDLPVFISADSVLQAWHRTYVEMLEEIEELQMATLLEEVLTNMSAQLPAVWQQYGNGPLQNNILDADYYLCVARSLLAGSQVPNALGISSQDATVTTTLNAINAQGYEQYFPIFGATRGMDFSQFKVRGHYTNSERLGRYFQAMMWCGRVDLRLATFAPNKEDEIRQLGTAVVLNHLLKQSNQSENWTAIENITRQFVGVTDSMTFAQLDELLTTANIQSPADITSLTTLTNLQTRLLTGELGVQSVRGDVFFSPLSREQLKLPRSFTICGQKFAMDAWACGQVVFDSILWSPDEPGKVYMGKVLRRKPSCLDVAFSVLGNDQVVPDLVARIKMKNTNGGVAFRDGYPYQHNLSAVRKVIDGQDAGIWTNNIYTAWIAALRTLSSSTVDSKYPEAMRTRAWANKTLNTQLASWTELRHDTVLYVKQPYTAGFVCGYPAGFVEPRSEFWQRMADMAQLTAGLISNLSLSGTVSVPSRADGSQGYLVSYDLASVKQNQITCLTNFAAKMRILKSISDKELAQQPLNQEETDFLKNTIERISDYTAGGRTYTGWYPGLFYRNSFQYFSFGKNEGSDLWDAMVTDVHTDVPDMLSGDPGAVIHEGIGHVHLMMIAVDNGPDRMVYAGPVLSHYEFEMPGATRMSDEEWKTNLRNGQKPPSPEWTKSYLVPAAYTLPEGY
jgi:hypothetical protein